MFIQNVSLKNIIDKEHYDPGWNSMLIQIVDPSSKFPLPKHQFREIHQFEFLDEDNEEGEFGEFCITDAQAKQIVDLLKHALKEEMNVIVHCIAGVCRSGAVVEVGTMLGFTNTFDYRLPNVLVKKKLMEAAGLSTYNEGG